ncbi:hypothetical protein FS837_005146 [Tulasnella sp. UAMH 9824]|nr:hypothetical protein FS837_005146 [Tulasnella sp. UAMH 9824]
MKEIMRLIIPYSDRWRTLRIFQVPDKVIRVVFDRLLNTPVPMLIKLEVSANYALRLKHRPAQTKWRFRPFWFGVVPSLQSMILERISYDHIDTRFASLRLLDILDPGMWVEGAVVIALKVHRILSLLPHLQSLRLRSYRSYPRYTDHDNTQSLGSYITSPLSHGSLVELSLGGPPRLRNVVISSLALPEVRYFVDRTRFYGDEWEIGLGICCLQVMETTRPFPNLISLRLAADNTRYNEKSNPTDPRNSSNMRHLQGALVGLKMLRSLTLDGMDLEGQGHLKCLSEGCPELRWLSLVCCIGYTLSELQSIIKLRKTLRANDSLVRLAVFGVLDDLSGPTETAAKLWLDKEWNEEFVYTPGFRYSQKAKGDYLYDVHSLV